MAKHNHPQKNPLKSGKKYLLIAFGVLIVIFLAVVLSRRPDYPDTYTPRPVLGSPNATVKIVVFSDYQCPACGSAHPVLEQVVKEFAGNVSLTYKYYPLTSIHPYAEKAAEGAECANDQGEFWLYSDLLYRNQQYLTAKDLREYAEDLGLDAQSFAACLGSGKKRKIVEADMREGNAKNIQGTPIIFVDGKIVQNWRYDVLRQTIVAQLAQAGQARQAG